MSGHSKWATIRRKKAVVDAKRGKVFTKHIREITVAARNGGGDPDLNPRLRLAVAAAKTVNMPQDNIQRAIKKGTGDLDGMQIEEVTYEGIGPGNVALIIETLTDNRNRTVAELRHMFGKNNGKFGETVAWNFDRKGLVVVPVEGNDEERVMEIALEAGAEDVRQPDEGADWEVVTAPEDLDAVRQAFEDAGIEPLDADLSHLPKATVPVEGKTADQLMRLVDALDEHDDVQQIHANYEISDEEMERIAGQS